MKTEVTMKTFASLIALAGLLLTACQPLEAVAPDTDAPRLPPPEPVEATKEPLAPPEADTPSPVAQEMARLSREDLGQRLGLSIDEITILEIEPVTWPDASLGCGQPEEVYAQVLTPGFFVRLEAKGRQYLYHTDQSSTVILCTGDTLPVFPVTPGDIQDGQPWMPVP